MSRQWCCIVSGYGFVSQHYFCMSRQLHFSVEVKSVATGSAHWCRDRADWLGCVTTERAQRARPAHLTG